MGNPSRASARSGSKTGADPPNPRRRQSAASLAANTELAKLGYTSELPRNLSMFSVLGLSFAIMAVPFGLSTTLALSLPNGGPATVLWGWVLVSLISLCIAASLAEICAVYPTVSSRLYRGAVVGREMTDEVGTGWRRVLLVCHARDQAVRAAHVVGYGLVNPGGQLDCDTQHKFLRRRAHPVCYHAVARRLGAYPLADDPRLLGRHARLPAR